MKKIFIYSFLSIITLNAMSQNNNDFAFKLFNQTISSTDNIITSPYSVTEAMAAAYAGAENNTKKEFEKVLFFNDNTPKQLKTYKNFLKKSQDSTTQVSLANAIWVKPDFKIKFCYKHKLKKKFGSEAFKLTSANDINNWVAKNTNNNIKKLVEDNDVNSSKLIITNVIYFKAAWEKKFNEKSTKQKTFTNGKGEKTKAMFMFKHAHYKYFKNDKLQAIELPYKGNNYSLLVILPEKINTNIINNDTYNEILNKLENKDIKLFLPKFKFKSSVELSETFKKMGLKEAFSTNADFSKISKEKLFISKVIHKTFFEVNETGTEAAASTAITMRTTVFNPKVITMEVNRPFIVILKDNKYNNILFIGIINQPDKK